MRASGPRRDTSARGLRRAARGPPRGGARTRSEEGPRARRRHAGAPSLPRPLEGPQAFGLSWRCVPAAEAEPTRAGRGDRAAARLPTPVPRRALDARGGPSSACDFRCRSGAVRKWSEGEGLRVPERRCVRGREDTVQVEPRPRGPMRPGLPGVPGLRADGEDAQDFLRLLRPLQDSSGGRAPGRASTQALREATRVVAPGGQPRYRHSSACPSLPSGPQLRRGRGGRVGSLEKDPDLKVSSSAPPNGTPDELPGEAGSARSGC